MEFTQAICRAPGQSIVSGLSGTEQLAPDYGKAVEQHARYVEVLGECGLETLSLQVLEEYPDSTFVEDAAVLTPECAIITAPGAVSRKGEIIAIEPVLKKLFSKIERIEAPGTLDGGDVMQIGPHFYIGLSRRTNLNGAQQLIRLLEQQGLTGSTIPVREFLHLKTGVTWVGNNTLLAVGECIAYPELQSFNVVSVTAKEAGAANCLLLNDTIVMPAGFSHTRQKLDKLKVDVIEVDISEFAKVDGGLTCLSLRF